MLHESGGQLQGKGREGLYLLVSGDGVEFLSGINLNIAYLPVQLASQLSVSLGLYKEESG